MNDAVKSEQIDNPLKINKERLREWKACSSGYSWFLQKFPQGGMFADVYSELKKERRHSDSGWLINKVFSELGTADKAAQIVFISGSDKKKIEQQVKECSGYGANAATTGYEANAVTTGYEANAATTGYEANAATTGKYANAATTGYGANAATTGEYANAATTGEYANAATTGYEANAATTGYGANAATTGYGANAATTGKYANAATTGDWANAATTGYGANAATTGYEANAVTEGNHAVAAALGIKSKAKAGVGGAIVLCHHNDEGHLIHIRASKVGENGVKPNVWYELDPAGNFSEVEVE